jgi:hypothetical protein
MEIINFMLKFKTHSSNYNRYKGVIRRGRKDLREEKRKRTLLKALILSNLKM